MHIYVVFIYLFFSFFTLQVLCIRIMAPSFLFLWYSWVCKKVSLCTNICFVCLFLGSFSSFALCVLFQCISFCFMLLNFISFLTLEISFAFKWETELRWIQIGREWRGVGIRGRNHIQDILYKKKFIFNKNTKKK